MHESTVYENDVIRPRLPPSYKNLPRGFWFARLDYLFYFINKNTAIDSFDKDSLNHLDCSNRFKF